MSALVIGRVADGEPLFRSELALARAEPEALLRGLLAVAEVHRASEVVLAVRQDYWSKTRALREALPAAARAASAASVRPLTARALRLHDSYPLNATSVAADLVEQHGVQAAATAPVYGAADLVARGRAQQSDRPPRLVSVVGYVARPAVIEAPLGTPIAQLVARCGGALPAGTRGLGWVPLVNGAASGWLGAQDDVTDEAVSGVFVLPGRHPLVARRATPLADIVRRAASACIGCRICTDVCPAYENGAPLEPHRISALMAKAAAPPAAVDDALALGALCCGGCNLCDVACPADLLPSRLVAALARGLGERGVQVEAASGKPFAIAPRAGRAARRYGIDRLGARLGVSALSPPEPIPQPL
ncbi:MAG: SLBB domain-containing protein [Myxococcales bacterium]|nr:SLBB domain-containing protein [Myxococcales bacterium]